ncbi:small, acid-soluble spore protein, alpha/beta type [Caldicellulosiruptoraceae bacterium PP1]
MARNKKLVPEATKALDQLKNEVATSIGVQLKPGYNGDLTTKQAGSIGGYMVKRMIQDYENRAAGK